MDLFMPISFGCELGSAAARRSRVESMFTWYLRGMLASSGALLCAARPRTTSCPGHGIRRRDLEVIAIPDRLAREKFAMLFHRWLLVLILVLPAGLVARADDDLFAVWVFSSPDDN